MSGALASRIAALETKIPKQRQRIVKVLCGEGQEAEVQQLLRSHGFDPAAENLLIIHHCIVSPAGQEPWSEPPSILSVT